MRRLNLKFLVAIVLVIGLLGAGVFAMRGYRVERLAESLLKQAEEFEYAGKREGVEYALKSYLTLRPEDTKVLARYGRLLDQHAETPEQRLQAMLMLEQVLRRDPDEDELRRRVVQIAMSGEIQRFSDARHHLEVLVGDDPKDSEALALLGRSWEASEEWHKAVERYEQAIEHDPGQIDAYVGLARVHREHLDDPERADAVMDELIDSNLENVEAYLERARYRDTLERDDDARVDVARARELSPDDADVLLESARLAPGPDEARSYLEHGLAVHPQDERMYRFLADVEARAGRVEQAIDALEGGVETHPESIELRYSLAELLIQDGQFDEAEKRIADLRKVENIRTELLDYLAAQVSVGLGRWVEATETLERVTARVRDEPELVSSAFNLLGRSYLELGNPDQGIAAYRRSLNASPPNISARVGLAEALARTSQIDEAIKEYRTIEAQVPGVRVPIARLQFIRTLQQEDGSRDWAAVERALDEAAEVAPESTEVPVLRAELYLAQDQADRAQSVLQQAREKASGQVELWVAEATLARSQGDVERALELLDQAEVHVDADVALLVARAQAWVDRGGAEAIKAIDSMAKDLEDRTGDDWARLANALAFAYFRLEERDRAEQLWRQVAERRSDDIEARMILFDLALMAEDAEEMRSLQEELRRIEGDDGSWWRFTEAIRLLAQARGGKDPQGALRVARGRLDEVARRRPNWARVPLLQAEVAELEGEPGRAIEKYQQAQRLGDRQPRVAQRLAQLLFERGRFDEADAAIRVLVRDEQTFTDDMKQLAAEVSLGAADPQRALTLAQEAVSADSADVRDQLWLGRMLWAAEQTAEAESAFRNALEMAPEEPEPYVALTLLLARTDRLEEARAVLREAGAKLPKEKATLALARCYEAVGQPEQAEQRYKAALEADPKAPSLLRSVATFYQNANRLQESEPYLRRLLDLGPEAPAADLAWARRTLAILLIARNDPAQTDAALVLIDQNLGSGEAIPDDRRLKALLLVTRPDRRAEAIGLLEDLERANPLAAGEQSLLAELHRLEGHWSDYRSRMLSLISSLKEDDPALPGYLISYVGNLLGQDSTTEARTWLNRLERIDPDRPEVVGLKARLLKALDQDAQAVALLQEYARDHAAEPQLAEAANNAAMVALYTSEADAAQYGRMQQQLEDAIERNPGSLSLKFDLANLQTLRGEFAEAEALYTQVLEADEGNAGVLNNLAWVVALQDGREAEALGLIKPAIDANPDDPDLLDTRGFILLEMGNGKAAIADLQAAIAKAPSVALPHFHLAQAYQLIGEQQLARDAFDRAKSVGLEVDSLHPYERKAYRDLSERLGDR